jgi:hypothetical protein
MYRINSIQLRQALTGQIGYESLLKRLLVNLDKGLTT